MHQDDVARLHARQIGIEPVRVRGTLVERSQQAIEGRLLTLTLIALRIDVEGAAARGRLRFGAGARLDAPLRIPVTPSGSDMRSAIS